MNKSKGFYITYWDKQGKLRKGAVYYSEQPEAFARQKRQLVHCLNDDLTPEKDSVTGKNLIGLVNADHLKEIIGYFD